MPLLRLGPICALCLSPNTGGESEPAADTDRAASCQFSPSPCQSIIGLLQRLKEKQMTPHTSCVTLSSAFQNGIFHITETSNKVSASVKKKCFPECFPEHEICYDVTVCSSLRDLCKTVWSGICCALHNEVSEERLKGTESHCSQFPWNYCIIQSISAAECANWADC